jgi:hypothetical protein
MLTPKSWLGFRIAHQLTAADNVIYLAALLDCAPKLEAARLPKDDNEAFAYRFAEGESVRIFEPALMDISDFYQRIAAPS